MYPGVWRHGDWIRITPRGGAVIYGRSDSTINRQGVRMGTSEIYRAARRRARGARRARGGRPRAGGGDGELWMVLFVVLREGVALDEELTAQIKRRIREDCSPRHVPNEVLPDRGGAAHAVGQGARGAGQAHPDGRRRRSEAASVDSLANPRSLDYFVELAKTLGAEAARLVRQRAEAGHTQPPRWRLVRGRRGRDARTPARGGRARLSLSYSPSERPDDLLHDLVRAAVDARHARVGEGARDRVLEHVAVAAVQLQAAVDDAALQLGAPPLGHRRVLGASARPRPSACAQRSTNARAISHFAVRARRA